MIDLADHTVLVSGGTPAIVTGLMSALHACGANVYPYDAAAINMADPAAVRASLVELDRIDTLIILPAYHSIGYFMDTSTMEWNEAIRLNYERAVYLAQAAAHHMIANQVPGSIIFVSTVAINMPMMQTGVYATSLAALHPLAKMAAVACGPHGIRVNTITLGWIESEWTAEYMQNPADQAYITKGIPLGEVATPKMLGEVCCFLASSLARHITGAIIPVDGGYTLTRAEGTSPYPPVSD